MKTLIGAGFVAGMLVLAGPATVNPAAAAPQAKVHTSAISGATDFSARRYYRRHYHRYYGYPAYYRPYYRPYYYARPYYYRPYPYYYAPAPFPLGIGFGFGFGPYGW